MSVREHWSVRVHKALGAANLEVERLKAELAGECAHTALSLIYRQERDDALATIERVRALIPKWVSDRATYPLDDIRAPMAFIAVKACGEELAAALEATS